MVLPIIGLLIGIAIGLVANIHIPAEYSNYVAIAILAALDSVFGAISASMQKNFNLNVFITGFFGNALIAAALTYLGKLLDVDLGMAAVLVFGTRMFNNFAVIRRILLGKHKQKDEDLK